MVPLKRRHFIHVKPETKPLIENGESANTLFTIESLKDLFDTLPSYTSLSFPTWTEGPAFRQYYDSKMLISNVIGDYFDSTDWHIFPNCVFYIDINPIIHLASTLPVQSSEQWKVEDIETHIINPFEYRYLSCQIRAYGGVVVSKIIPETTHVILFEKSRFKIFQSLNARLKKSKMIISPRWITDSIENHGRLEEKFYME
jgi:hypothetical protein